MTLVKICGLTNPDDAQVAMDVGADIIGFVNADTSPRYLTPEEIAMIINEVQPVIPTVMVTHSQEVDQILNNHEAAGTDILQLHAPLTMDEYQQVKDMVPTVIANISLDSDLKEIGDDLITRVCEVSQIADYILFDTKAGKEIGGTGKTYNWALAAELKDFAEKPVIMAGGLTPLNVSEAIHQVEPFAVDVSSGVELQVGQKDPEKVIAFIKNAKFL